VTEACVAALGEGDGVAGAAGAAGADEKAIPPTPRGTPATRGIRRSSRGPPPSPTRSRSSATGRPRRGRDPARPRHPVSRRLPGFRRLKRAGWIDEVPRLFGAQAAGIAPIVRELHGADAADPERRVNAAADGIQIAEPVRKREIFDAIADTDGDALAVTQAATDWELDRLHAAGFYTEPTCAVAPAALRELRERGVLAPNDDVVVPLTGSGLKG